MDFKFHVAEVPSLSGRIMYRGSVTDTRTGEIVDHTRPYFNRKNARAAAIALRHELVKRDEEAA